MDIASEMTKQGRRDIRIQTKDKFKPMGHIIKCENGKPRSSSLSLYQNPQASSPPPKWEMAPTPEKTEYSPDKKVLSESSPLWPSLW